MGSLVLAGATSGSTTITPTDAVTATVTLPSTGGTIQTSGAGFTTNGVAYASSTSALTTGSALNFNGTNLLIGTTVDVGGGVQINSSSSAQVRMVLRYSASTITFFGSYSGIVGSGNATDTMLAANGGALAFAAGGTSEQMRLDSSGNLLVGQTSATGKLSVTGTGSGNTGILAINATDNASAFVWASQAFLAGMTSNQNFVHFIGKSASTLNAGYIGYKYSGTSGSATNILTFGHYAADNLMNLDGSGALLVGTTTSGGWQGNARGEFYSTGAGGFGGAGGVALSVYQSGSSVVAQNIRVNATSTAFMQFQYNGATTVGSITTNGSSTSYVTSSDYRLKNTIAPITGALAKVALLKPVTYKWNVDGSDSQGFIAHELQEIVPECVHGSKDGTREEEYEVTPAVKDEEGNITTPAVMGTRIVPVYQGIDTSFLVATLTSAIQELSTLITAQQSTIQSLTERITALEGART